MIVLISNLYLLCKVPVTFSPLMIIMWTKQTFTHTLMFLYVTSVTL